MNDRLEQARIDADIKIAQLNAAAQIISELNICGNSIDEVKEIISAVLEELKKH